MTMRSVIRHIAFWVIYMMLCLMIDYQWVEKALPDLSSATLLANAAMTVICVTGPEIVFAYFIIYVAYPQLLSKKLPVWLTVLQILAALAISIAAVRLISFNLFEYVLYDGRMAEPELWSTSYIFRALIYIGFSCGLSFSVELFHRQLVAKEREKQLIEEKLSAELKALRGQLHPHFLFNTLNNIYALTRKKSDLAPAAVMKLSELLHFTLYQSDKDTISLARELSLLDDYIGLERMRYSSRLSVSFEKEVSNLDIPIAPLLLLPLVENAFKHGASESTSDTFIAISVTQKDKEIVCVVENPYDSNKPVLAGSKSIGLDNLKRQLQLLYTDYTLDVLALDDIFRVTLRINTDSYGKA